jgi:hypothetical protein
MKNIYLFGGRGYRDLTDEDIFEMLKYDSQQESSSKLKPCLSNFIPQISMESYRLGSLEMGFPEQCVCREIIIPTKNDDIVIMGVREHRIKRLSLINRVMDIKSNATLMGYP